MKDKEKTEIMLKYLIDREISYGKGRTNVIFPELRLGSGYCGVSQRRIDLFIISSNAGNQTTAYEIKASRSDFKKDIQDDLKQRGARLYANEFFYVAPRGMLKREEVPLWAGLIEFDFDKYEETEERDKKYLFATVVDAPLHPKYPPSWGLICSMIRHVNKDIGKATIAELNEELRILKITNKSQTDLLKRIANNDQYAQWELQRYKTI